MGILFRIYVVAGSLVQSRLISIRVPEAASLVPRVPLGLYSHFGPVRHEWFYRIAPKIIETLKPYHDDDDGGGGTVGKENDYVKWMVLTLTGFCCMESASDRFLRSLLVKSPRILHSIVH